MPHPFYNIKHLRLSYSTQGTYDSCERKLELKKFFPHPGRDESIPGETGKCLHAGYQDYLIHKNRDSAIVALALNYPIHLCADPNNFRSLEACYATLNTMIDSGAFVEYKIASVHCLDGQIRPAIEVPFEIVFKDFSLSDEEDIPVTYVGYIDAILYDMINDEYIIGEIKTTRNWLTDLTSTYFFDTQCIPYAFVIEQLVKRKVEALNIKYLVTYVDMMKPKSTIYPFIKTKTDIEDWARAELIRLHDIKRYYNMGWFPRKSKACVSFKQTCQFFELCQSRDHENIRKYLLMGQEEYVEEPIEPWIRMELELAA